jgi:hypothetical protein
MLMTACLAQVATSSKTRSEAPYGALKTGFDGPHTDSNHRLIYTWAWASPQKCRAAGPLAAVKSHLMTASF